MNYDEQLEQHCERRELQMQEQQLALIQLQPGLDQEMLPLLEVLR